MKRTRDVVKVTRRMPDGRIGIVEKVMTAEKRLTKDEQRAQASAMMMRRLFGGKDASIQGLATEFDLVPATVSKRLALARTDGVPDEARQIFIQEMLPAAMAVVLETLAGDDPKLRFAAAKMVVEGLDAMGIPPAQGGLSAGAVEESFEVWRTRITRRTGEPSGSTGEAADGGGTVIEAIPVPGPPGSPDPTPAEDAPFARAACQPGSLPPGPGERSPGGD